MGRKIISKRKTPTTESGSVSNTNFPDRAAADVQAGNSLPLEPLVVGKTLHAHRGRLIQSSGPNKKYKRG
jgi:hypothetical protein